MQVFCFVNDYFIKSPGVYYFVSYKFFVNSPWAQHRNSCIWGLGAPVGQVGAPLGAPGPPSAGWELLVLLIEPPHGPRGCPKPPGHFPGTGQGPPGPSDG